MSDEKLRWLRNELLNGAGKLILALSLVLAVVQTRPVLAQDSRLPASGLNRGVNFGNMLEAPYEGAWGLTVEERFFEIAAKARMDHIRLPVSWTYHASQTAPFTIDSTFFERIDWCLDQAEAYGLKLVLNNHHYDELNQNPTAEQARALAIWNQIATRYADRGEFLYFEIQNEPHQAFNDNPQLWNQYLAEALAVIRQTNPDRKVLAGPVFWNSIEALESFDPPEDENLIATFHYYSPFEFTHQGAEWINPPLPTGVRWRGSYMNLGNGFQNWSWGTQVESLDGGIEVTYEGGWAGLYAHSSTPVPDVQSIVFTADKAMSLLVTANDPSGNGGSVTIETVDGKHYYEIALNDLGSPATISDIYIQNNSPNPQPTWRCDDFFLTTNQGDHPVLITAREAIKIDIETATSWATARGLPMYLGEFGAYKYGRMAHRANWTRTVRNNAERAGIGWGYWELAAGFGFYDPETGRFRRRLFRALIQ